MIKHPTQKRGARQIGVPFAGITGQHNAITDVPGIGVGMRTVIESKPRCERHRLVRTGVTAIMPHFQSSTPVPVYAGFSRFNGNGEMTGTHWIRDAVYFVGPVILTNSHAIGIAHHATVRWMIDRYASTYQSGDLLWIMPVIAETYDGVLNDINALPLTEMDIIYALEAISGGSVEEGNCGGGTGMIAYGFKGGTGTASRKVYLGNADFTIGALVQANHGQRDWLTIAGVPVGKIFQDDTPPELLKERGSVVVVIATDLPLLPHQLQRVARGGAIGIGRNGSVGGNNSGDMFLAFSTGNVRPMPHVSSSFNALSLMNDECLDPVFEAVVGSVEEAVVNALLAAEDMGGTRFDTHAIKALNHDKLLKVLHQHRALDLV